MSIIYLLLIGTLIIGLFGFICSHAYDNKLDKIIAVVIVVLSIAGIVVL